MKAIFSNHSEPSSQPSRQAIRERAEPIKPQAEPAKSQQFAWVPALPHSPTLPRARPQNAHPSVSAFLPQTHHRASNNSEAWVPRVSESALRPSCVRQLSARVPAVSNASALPPLPCDTWRPYSSVPITLRHVSEAWSIRISSPQITGFLLQIKYVISPNLCVILFCFLFFCNFLVL